VTLDGNITSLNGLTTDPIGLFNLSIFHQSGLDPSKPHSLTLTNAPNGAGDVDIDWIEVEVGDGNTAYEHRSESKLGCLLTDFIQKPFTRHMDGRHITEHHIRS
jgi:hypothetical protein